ncbi:hypothetical protein [Candidatus Synchoanobacter obligatus]|uniref:Uncharacterized protein n=1 Tax=Candidatus Synchoanobacter obligatus TaxID=2919597 RepID=A0ABT1L5Z4_9GAMM|nr:hypothetical protein [Candidatus Synchoanobacter obligatus]MCP8352597.1 hypothetical protein [Candidatus Synchoanobacter obligatus]
MYIKLNAIVGASLLFSAVASHAIDCDIDVRFGMKTDSKQFLQMPHNTGDRLNVGASIDDISDAMGYNVPEFVDFSFLASHEIMADVYTSSYVKTRTLERNIDIGTSVSYQKKYLDNQLFAQVYADAYYSWFWNGVDYQDVYPIHLDLGARVDIPVFSQGGMYIELSYPLRHQYRLEAEDAVADVHTMPSLAIGYSLFYKIYSTDSGESVVHPAKIAFEPIAIPVVGYVKPEVVKEEPVTAEPQVIVNEAVEEESLGWFAWIIEYIARLFRF